MPDHPATRPASQMARAARGADAEQRDDDDGDEASGDDPLAAGCVGSMSGRHADHPATLDLYTPRQSSAVDPYTWRILYFH